MALTTITQYPDGWLPYGSDDDSVWFYHPLTSLPTTGTSVGQINCNSITTTGTFSADGFLAGTTGTKSLRLNQIAPWSGSYVATALNHGGQISFDVDKEFIAVDDVANGSTGFDVPSDEWAMSLSGTSQLLGKNAASQDLRGVFMGQQFQRNFLDSTAANANAKVTTVGKSDKVTIKVGWNNSTAWRQIGDGIIHQLVTGAANDANLAADLFVGAFSTATGAMTTHRISNLQVSSRPPAFSMHPLLRKVVMWGDSQVKFSIYTASPFYDNQPIQSFARVMGERGFIIQYGRVQANVGDTVQTTGANDLTDTIAALLAEDPTLVLIRGGHNDAKNASFNAASFETDLKAHITSISAHTSVLGIVLSTVPTLADDPSYTATWGANTTTINNIYKAIPAWFDAAFPVLAGRVINVDTYAEFGGENFAAFSFDGVDFHYGALGGHLQGKSFANGVIYQLLK